jgi:hypothetical protein
MRQLKYRRVKYVIGAGWLLVLGLMLAGSTPLEASKPGMNKGKNVSVSGVPGCDCTQPTAEECWCNLPA